MDKKSARNLAKERVKSLSDAEKLIKSAKIASDFTDYFVSRGFKSIFIYKSVKNEVSTESVIEALLKRGIKVFVPKTSGDDMFVAEINDNTEYLSNAFGIPEPVSAATEFYGADVNVVPLVAFDEKLNRLGHGKGYYDRYLARATGKICAFAFGCQNTGALETETHDVKMHLIFTENGVLGEEQ